MDLDSLKFVVNEGSSKTLSMFDENQPIAVQLLDLYLLLYFY